MVSQTLLNLVALAILAAIMFSSVDFFNGHEDALLIVAIVPFVLLVFVLVLPGGAAPPGDATVRAAAGRRRLDPQRCSRACARGWRCSSSRASV